MTYKELEMYLQENNISKMDFCRETGISPQILTNAKSRGGHFSATTMEKMNAFLNKGKIEVESLTEHEQELINIYRTLDEESKRELVIMLAYLKDRNKN